MWSHLGSNLKFVVGGQDLKLQPLTQQADSNLCFLFSIDCELVALLEDDSGMEVTSRSFLWILFIKRRSRSVWAPSRQHLLSLSIYRIVLSEWVNF